MLLKGLYAITDPKLTPAASIVEQVEAALLGGANIIQFRDKSQDDDFRLTTAQALRELTQQHNALLIINDDVELCLRSQADGVHLGQEDTALIQARERLGSKKIIGATCHGSLALAEKAMEDGADYLAFGCFFPSSTKPGAPPAKLSELQHFVQNCPLPTVAIGGINLNNAAPLVQAGFSMLAVVQDVFGTTNSAQIRQQCQQYQPLFNANSTQQDRS